MPISKTIQNIYIMALKNKTFFKQSKDKHIIYEYYFPRPRGIIQKIMSYFYGPNDAHAAHVLYPVEDDVPICEFVWCGVNVVKGRRYCIKHMRTCIMCNIKEVDIMFGGHEVCWDCYGEICRKRSSE